MKINEHILSIPPHISTAWENVSHLQMNTQGSLEVILHNGTKVTIPNLEADVLEKVFAAHALSIESQPATQSGNPFGLDLNTSGMVLSGMENFTGMMQHDPNQSDAPNLPIEILEKISEMGKAMGIDTDTFNIPEGDPNCNCPYCQISRAVHGKQHLQEKEDNSIEKEVSQEELTFREWNIDQKNDKLYEVTNPFEESEKYSVYLGDPIGCTCGKNNCEHILAVLKS
ncbi:MAG: hypothetical protein SP4CHLAM5_03780 [Chlamydiia bacterium]|nr:hypothetical protein [Chlamydiia bacterium]MCH9618252.1 hypothetical protein [Chlamydiia bacterium]MCH9624648.1 hypothetical protein [Chlamydiia bacterium]